MPDTKAQQRELLDKSIEIARMSISDVLKNGEKWTTGSWIVFDSALVPGGMAAATDSDFALCKTKFCLVGAIEMATLIVNKTDDKSLAWLTHVPAEHREAVRGVVADNVVMQYFKNTVHGQIANEDQAAVRLVAEMARVIAHQPTTSINTSETDRQYFRTIASLKSLMAGEGDPWKIDDSCIGYSGQLSSTVVSWNDNQEKPDPILAVMRKAISNMKHTKADLNMHDDGEGYQDDGMDKFDAAEPQ